MLQAVGQYPTKDEEKKLIKDHSDGKLITAKQFYSMVKVSSWVASPPSTHLRPSSLSPQYLTMVGHGGRFDFEWSECLCVWPS